MSVDVAGSVEPGRGDRGDPSGALEGGCEPGEAGLVAGEGQADGEFQGAVKAAAEPVGEQVVGLARCLLGGVVA